MIFTIGHSNHTIEHFIDLLKTHKIDTIVDVRSVTKSGYSKHFNKPNLVYELRKNNISYIDMGKLLGGRPFDKSVCNALNEIEFNKIETREWYKNGISRLIEVSSKSITAVMCSEENPVKCHRGYIISHSLLKRNIEVMHIRGDKTQQKAQFIEKQGALF